MSQLGITVHTMTCGDDLIAKSVNKEIAQQTQGIAGHLQRPEQFMKQAIEGIDLSIEEDAFELEVEKEAEKLKLSQLANLRLEATKKVNAAKEAKLQEELRKGKDHAEAQRLADALALKENARLEKETVTTATTSKNAYTHSRYRLNAAAKGATETEAEAMAATRAQKRGARYNFHP